MLEVRQDNQCHYWKISTFSESLKVRSWNCCTNSKSSQSITGKSIIKSVKPKYFWYEHPSYDLLNNRNIKWLLKKPIEKNQVHAKAPIKPIQAGGHNVPPTGFCLAVLKRFAVGK